MYTMLHTELHIPHPPQSRDQDAEKGFLTKAYATGSPDNYKEAIDHMCSPYLAFAHVFRALEGKTSA